MNKAVRILIVILVLGLIGVGIYFGAKSLNKEKDTFDYEVVTTITMDINPSIEINLNKDDVVINVVGLNKDSEKILKGKEFKGKEIEETLDIVVDTLVDTGYLKEEKNTILINVETKKEETETKLNVKAVEEKVKEVVETNEVECELVVQQVEVTEKLKELADKYDITPSKAYYISEQIKETEEIKFEDVVEKPIEEIKEEVEEKKEEIKKAEEEQKKSDEEAKKKAEEEKKKQQQQQSQQGGNKGTSQKSYQDLLDEGMMEPQQLRPLFIQKYGVQEPMFGSMFSGYSDKRCKYNMAYEVEFIGYLTKHTGIMCQFEGTVYDYQKTQLVSSVIGEDRAYQIALDKLVSEYGFDPETITEKRTALDYSDLKPYLYSYNVYIATTMSGQFRATIKATNGEIVEAVKF